MFNGLNGGTSSLASLDAVNPAAERRWNPSCGDITACDSDIGGGYTEYDQVAKNESGTGSVSGTDLSLRIGSGWIAAVF